MGKQIKKAIFKNLILPTYKLLKTCIHVRMRCISSRVLLLVIKKMDSIYIVHRNRNPSLGLKLHGKNAGFQRKRCIETHIRSKELYINKYEL